MGKITEWVVIKHEGERESLEFGPTVRLEDAERYADTNPLLQVKRVIFKMGGCKDWLGYYLAIGTSDGEYYKIRET
jgi:hypothetical protein